MINHKRKKDLFLLESKNKKNMINCKYVIFQLVVLMFFQFNFNKLYIRTNFSKTVETVLKIVQVCKRV